MSSRRHRPDGLARRVVGGLVVAAGLTACGGGSGEAVPEGFTSIRPEAQTESVSPTSTPTPAATVDEIGVDEVLDRIDAAVPEPAAYTVEGGGEFPEGTLRLTGRVGAAGARVDVTVETPEGTTRSILIRDVAYLQDDELSASDSFVRVALDDPDNPLGALARDRAAQASRGFDLSVLRCCATSAVRHSSAEIGGTPVELIRVAVDPARAADNATDERARMAFEAEIGEGDFFYDLWLDDDGLLRALAYYIDDVPVQFTFSNWGQPPGIRPPDPEQVLDGPATPED